MAHILILSLVFPPDSVSTAQIVGDLASDLQARGHSVVVLTTLPHYNPDLEVEARQQLHNCGGPRLRKSLAGRRSIESLTFKNVQEIYLDVAINPGAIRNKWLICFFLWLECFVDSKALIIKVIASQNAPMFSGLAAASAVRVRFS
jgi:hypothetical protein